MASVNLSGVLSSIGSVIGPAASGSTSDFATSIVNNMAIGALSAAGLAALQHPDVKQALLPFDPLNLAGKPTSLNPAPAASTPAAVPVATTHLITAAQAAALGWTTATLPAGVAISG